MTWHQWHHTASRSRITKRFSAVARVNRSLSQPFHLTGSDANDGDAATAALANASMRTNFMTSPGGAIVLAVTPSYVRRKNPAQFLRRSEEHTSELQSLRHLVC